MKRNDIIELLKQAGTLMDAIDGTELKDKKTGKTVGTISKGDIEGMQTALVFCCHMLEGDYEVSNPLKLVTDMLDIHGVFKLGLDHEDVGADD